MLATDPGIKCVIGPLDFTIFHFSNSVEAEMIPALPGAFKIFAFGNDRPKGTHPEALRCKQTAQRCILAKL
jgi:hypothetical protein